MTIALAVCLFAVLMIYCGVYGKSLRHALVGKSVSGGAGSLVS